MAFCSSVSLWLGQSIAFTTEAQKIQRICDSSSPIANSEDPILSQIFLSRKISESFMGLDGISN